MAPFAPVIQMVNARYCQDKLDLYVAMQHHCTCLLYLLQGNRLQPALSSGLFFRRNVP
jgi:hypothetical protein